MSTSRFPLCLALVLLAGTPLFSQTAQASRIESRLKAKLEQKEFQTTAGMVEAYDEAVKAYRVEVSRVFEKLAKGLPKFQASALIQSQHEWLKYFESMRLCTSYIYDAPGTMHRPEAMVDLKNILQHRLDEMCQMFLDWDTSESLDNPEEVPDAEAWCQGPSHERLNAIPNDPLAPSAFERKATGMGVSLKKPE